jgi:hypothetical protein
MSAVQGPLRAAGYTSEAAMLSFVEAGLARFTSPQRRRAI